MSPALAMRIALWRIAAEAVQRDAKQAAKPSLPPVKKDG
jgi:hypothetical protein